jgi:hypothetical protein
MEEVTSMNQLSWHAVLAVMCFSCALSAEELPGKELPGKGLAQHPFLYCGEWQNQSLTDQTMYLVRDGKVVWSYKNPKRGELGDCTRLSNGDIVFSRQFGASEITPDKRIVWNYDAPPGTEIHTAYPMGMKRVLIMQNGSPAKLLILRKRDNHVETELTIPTKSPSTHGQFRHVRPTKAGTFLVPHMDFGRVDEYSRKGQVIWSVEAPGAWAAVRLKNGNTLISGNQNGYVREINKQRKVVWEINKHDLPAYPLYTVQEVSRLSNGNTLLNNWTANLPKEQWPHTIQLIEVTPEKKVIWALSDWTDLGPASATQLLDEPGVPEKGDLQR